MHANKQKDHHADAENERLEAEQLLAKADKKRKMRIKAKLDKKIDAELEQMRIESKKRKQERLRLLLEQEQAREHETQDRLKRMEYHCKQMYKKKQRLVRKLLDLQVKETIHDLASDLKRHPNQQQQQQQHITYEQVQQMAKQKQRELVKKQHDHTCTNLYRWIKNWSKRDTHGTRVLLPRLKNFHAWMHSRSDKILNAC